MGKSGGGVVGCGGGFPKSVANEAPGGSDGWFSGAPTILKGGGGAGYFGGGGLLFEFLLLNFSLNLLATSDLTFFVDTSPPLFATCVFDSIRCFSSGFLLVDFISGEFDFACRLS
jgi:hypothetical protein